MNKFKTLISTLAFSTMLFSCKPSITSESNALKEVISPIKNISHDSIAFIKESIRSAEPKLEAYKNKADKILSENISSEEITSLLASQKSITNIYIDNVDRYDDHLTGKQRNIFRKSMKGGVNRSFGYIFELDTITTKEFRKLSDSDRNKVINEIKAKMDKELEGLSALDTYFRKGIYNTTEAIIGTNKFLN